MVPKLPQVYFLLTYFDLLWALGLRLCTGLLQTDGTAQLRLGILWSLPSSLLSREAPCCSPWCLEHSGGAWGSSAGSSRLLSPALRDVLFHALFPPCPGSDSIYYAASARTESRHLWLGWRDNCVQAVPASWQAS